MEIGGYFEPVYEFLWNGIVFCVVGSGLGRWPLPASGFPHYQEIEL
jgi:hypothetical protein